MHHHQLGTLTALWLGLSGCLGTEPDAASYAAPLQQAAQPLAHSEHRFVYNEVSDSYCRDGSHAGLAVNTHRGSSKLMIYMEQGGGCFSPESCALNPADVSLDLVGLGVITGAEGLFKRDEPRNPLRDWNFVYIPYCTGDLHLGAKPEGAVPGVGPQKFVGFSNMQRFVPRIAATFPDATEVLLVGASAGGMGSFAHLQAVQDAFPELRVKALNDAGPVLSAEIFQPCLQSQVRELWGLSQTWIELCGASCPRDDDYLQDFGVHLAERFTDRPLGYLVGARDASLRMFAALSEDNCSAPVDLFSGGVDAALFTADLLRFRSKVQRFENFHTFYGDSEEHTFSALPSFYTLQAQGTTLVDWFTKFMADEMPGHAGP